ncbi:hypothetical protein BN7_6316 [Wickerhamomyces ciferrii]|uniref:Uncharacterized protein n=1 Tax=Wickerhamomyces ciferrii (strain ATCC 14091 / BCRC 22168 / CBS 111 / JCM 3599 / NBRC 0793 / NRRL Y-1031 F-60-10) TaxID=1206466 RepID=K0KZF1_WICCF|nr:uncharacterized protein BN7_6316 [Wickerhamomyces ciferrii]CCH46719.1 hypothetical protein BN7_6316 [Wickerhamomyces ciferrii]
MESMEIDAEVNVVFESDEEAKDALNNLTLNGEIELQPSEERQAQKIKSDKPDTHLTIRISNLSDKKVKNAAAYSRYYLYNPPKYELDKEKRKSKGNNYREREPVRFRRSNVDDDDDDGTDLFPEKAPKSENIDSEHTIPSTTEDVDLISSDQISNNATLSSRIGLRDDLNDSNPDNTTSSPPSKSSSLLDRIGSKFKEKNLEKDDLFS